ncbi:replication initiation factor domain-containing protein [Listeria welshimeri]|uniref:replication initiation factor domain-containing protein n=1 Tax=Listeria welshimeri TaxID=1643 RepID=UPI001886C625|nr:replication initiation factor domain-containing protein [Listeria welshimeri]MBF2468050.1 replication initiation factor domain-containing protein [Listeria welshimeri]MBF2593625.1 replication initiation factor domain-containing protein [Listeria welshimeri]
MKYMRHIAKEVDDWTRVEAEFSGEYAHQLTDAIRKCNTDEQLKNVIVSSLIDRYMFFYVNSNRPHKLTRLMLELLDKKDFHFESPSPRNNLLEQSIDHLIKGSGLLPTLWKVQQIWGDNTAQDLMDYLYKQYYDQFEANDDHIS